MDLKAHSPSDSLNKSSTVGTLGGSPLKRLQTSPFRSIENTDLYQQTDNNKKSPLANMVCSDNTGEMGKVTVGDDIKCDSSPVNSLPNPAFRDSASENGHIGFSPKMIRSNTTGIRGMDTSTPRCAFPSSQDLKNQDLSKNHITTTVPNSSNNCRIRTDNFADHYHVGDAVGRGKFAVVKRCQHIASGRKYAAKFLRKRRKGKDCRSDALKEVKMLEMAITHPRIVNLIEVFETSHDLIIVTEFAEGGELYQKIVEDECFEEQEAQRLLRQILEGVLFLHERNIVHLDIKPQNILLTAQQKGNIKLCDLGFARPINSDEDVRDIIGTPDYVAPEILSYEPIHTSSDIWSIGVLTYVLLTGCSPFAGDNNQETFLNISQANLDFPEELFGDVSSQAVDFISKLLVLDPTDRLTARECLYHPWLQKTPADSPVGQRRALTPPSPDTLAEEPAKKCRCQASTPPPSASQLSIFETRSQVEEISEQDISKTINFDRVSGSPTSPNEDVVSVEMPDNTLDLSESECRTVSIVTAETLDTSEDCSKSTSVVNLEETSSESET